VIASCRRVLLLGRLLGSPVAIAVEIRARRAGVNFTGRPVADPPTIRVLFGALLGSERGGREHAERAVGTGVVELVAPVGGEHLGFQKLVELFDRE